MPSKHGLKVISKVRRAHLSAATRIDRRMPSERDQWRLYAIAMARKIGMVGAEEPIDAQAVHPGAHTFRIFRPEVREWLHSGHWLHTPREELGTYEIPARVVTFQPIVAEYESEA